MAARVLQVPTRQKRAKAQSQVSEEADMACLENLIICVEVSLNILEERFQAGDEIAWRRKEEKVSHRLLSFSSVDLFHQAHRKPHRSLLAKRFSLLPFPYDLFSQCL
jgi:hypothetical protein